MEDNKRDYSDFFRGSDGRDNSNEGNRNESADEARRSSERPSYYYSYGPYKSDMQQEAPRAERDSAEDTMISSEDHVQVTPPRPLRPFGYAGQELQPQAPQHPGVNTAWSVNQPAKRRGSFKSIVASFLAGALVISSLMFASDHYNLFSADKGVMNTNGAAGGGSGSGSGSTIASSSSGVQGAAFDARPTNIAQIVQNASPAVVLIETYVKPQRTRRGNSLFDDPFFRQFFGDSTTPQQDQNNNSMQKSGMGSGFIFEQSGYILTNEHVVEGAEEIRVTVEGYDEPFIAKALGSSFDLDLAVLKIEPKDGKTFPIIPMGDPNQTNVGDWVVAIGNPYGFDHTVTVGVLSAKGRPIDIPDTQGTREYKDLLQTDAAINPGNSGGPLLNLKGEFIGINTAVSSQAQGIGFAIPTTTINSVLENLKNNVEIPKAAVPYLGVELANINDSIRSQLGLSNNDGALVAALVLGSPAFKGGVKQYDVITSINGQAVKNREELIAKVQAQKVGDKVKLAVVRDGKQMELEVTLGDKNQFENQQQ